MNCSNAYRRYSYYWDYLTCDDIGTDDLFGCGSPNNDDNWLFFGNNDASVAVK